MKDQDEQMFAYATWMSKYGGFVKDMTLRDHFAGLAMQGLMDAAMPMAEIAPVAYQMADEMLKAREK